MSVMEQSFDLGPELYISNTFRNERGWEHNLKSGLKLKQKHKLEYNAEAGPAFSREQSDHVIRQDSLLIQGSVAMANFMPSILLFTKPFMKRMLDLCSTTCT